MALGPAARRRLAHGSNATIVSVVVVVIVVLLYTVVDRFRVRLDVSADQSSVLLPDTRNKLRLLEADTQPVTVTAFSAQAGKKDAYFKDRQLQDLLDELDYASSIVETRFVDFDRERLTAEALGVTEYGTLVIQRGEQRVDLRDRDLFRRVGKGADQRLEFLGEAAVTRGFAQLLSDTRRVVYVLRGHGEPDPESHEPGGLSELADLLDQEHYELKPLDLVRDREAGEAPRVPDDAAALLVIRPTAAIPALEEDVLLAWIASGGSALFSVEPGVAPPALLQRFGVAVPEGKVLDTLLVFPYPDRPVPRYKSSPITRDLAEASMVTVVAGVAPLQAAVPAKEGIRSTTLLETGRDGWIERGGELREGQAVYQPEVDGAGPVTMALTLEVSAESGLVRKKPARIVVLGDTDLLENGLLSEGPGNPTFLVNCVRWLVGDDGRISVVGRPTATRRLALTDEDRGKIRWLALGLGPVLAIVLGAGVWASRRGR